MFCWIHCENHKMCKYDNKTYAGSNISNKEMIKKYIK